MAILEAKDLYSSYFIGSREVGVLHGLNLTINRGEFVGIQGPSGSGKSTLFYILGMLLRPSRGQLFFDDIDVTTLSSDELAQLRNRKIGFIFQQFHLIPKTSVLENILVPTHYPSETAMPEEKHRTKAIGLAEQLGLGKHLGNFPNQLSGGQQQRVAIARALMNDVDLILADEPTGNLDSHNALQVLELLKELNRRGKTIIMITHDSSIAKHCSKVYHIHDGAFRNTEINFQPEISVALSTEGDIQKLTEGNRFSVISKIARSTFPLAKKGLLRNKPKSALTMLGVTIGVAAVLVTVTLGQFIRQKILETYESLGTNKIVLQGYAKQGNLSDAQAAYPFTKFNWDRELLTLKKLIPGMTAATPLFYKHMVHASAGGISTSDQTSIIGVNQDYTTVTNRPVRIGRNISAWHIENKSPVCLVGIDIAKILFAHSNALNQFITIDDPAKLSFTCQIIGILGPKSNEGWSSLNLNVVLPYTYFQSIIDTPRAAELHDILLTAPSSGNVEKIGERLLKYFEQIYGSTGWFTIDTNSALIAQMKKFLTLFSLLLGAIALITLAVGGIGINNMMQVSVAERIKEFGLRKALGATNRSIRIQVLMESFALCTVAGLVGIVLGFCLYSVLIFGAAQVVPRLRFEWVVEPLAMLLSVASIVVVGVLSGLIPAIRAERLQIIEALRSE